MKIASKQYIINTVYKTNTLPVISKCNTSCVFCSHKQNPQTIDVYRLGELSLEDFREIIEFLSKDKKIVIGEAATRIVEGEPLLHKDIVDILWLIRKRYKRTPIQITTNGILLNTQLVDKLTEIGNLELNISVNCIHPEKRRKILHIKNEDDIAGKLSMIKGRLKYSGSLVVVPDILTYDDIEETVCVLCENEADCVRVYLPGYTSLSKTGYRFETLYQTWDENVKKLRKKYDIPIIMEPAVIHSLQCTIEGIIKNSPAYKAGLREGDVILSINGQSVATRVDAFDKAYRSGDPEVIIKRNQSIVTFRIHKKPGSSPGFILLYDIDPDVGKKMNAAAKRHGAKKVLIITSELAFDVLHCFLTAFPPEFNYDIVKAGNDFFGGTIKCAGLLTCADVESAFHEYLIMHQKPELVLLPPVMFDFKNQDLLGRSIHELEDKFQIPVDIS